MSHPQSAGLGRTGTGTSACDQTYPAWYAERRTCCSNSALVGLFGSIVREPCANNSFRTPLAGRVLLCMTTRKLSIPSRVSELTSTGCRDRSGKASITDGQDLQANHADRARTRLKGHDIYLNEDLTARRAKLAYDARQLKKAKKIVDCWSSYGKVIVKDSNNKIREIKSPSDLLNI